MQVTEIKLQDDIDGSPAAQTIKFGIDGAQYAIDLSEDHVLDFEEALEPYIASARVVRRIKNGQPGRPRSVTDRSRSRDIRAFALAQGLATNARGRLANQERLTELWEKAGRPRAGE